MSTIDKAFIKAYGREHESAASHAAAVPNSPRGGVPSATQTLEQIRAQQQAMAMARLSVSEVVYCDAAHLPEIPSPHIAVTNSTPATAPRPATAVTTAQAAEPAVSETTMSETSARTRTSRFLKGRVPKKSAAPAALPAVAAPATPTVSTPTQASAPRPAPAAAPKSAPRETASPMAKASAAPQQAAATGLLPVFEVPQFVWPAVVETLLELAATELNQLAAEMVQQSRAGRKLRLISSCRRGDGCTTMLLSLARAAARAGCKVAIVDADFARADLAGCLGVVAEAGWEDILTSELPLSEALVESLEDGITLLPLRQRVEDLRPLLGNARVASTLSTLQAHYDLVLLDIGPLVAGLNTLDVIAQSNEPRIDNALLVRDGRHTSHAQVEAAGRRLAAAGINGWDVAENFGHAN